MSKALSSDKLSAALERDKIFLSAGAVRSWRRRGAPGTRAGFGRYYREHSPASDTRTLQESINDWCRELNRK